MEWFLDKEFWKDQFNLSKEYLDSLSLLLENKGESCDIQDLAEGAVKSFLKDGQWVPEEYRESKVLSYRDEYKKGDKLIVFKKESEKKKVVPSFVSVILVLHKNNYSVVCKGSSTILSRCDVITVLTSSGEWQQYICNSPDYINVKQNYLTPEAIVAQFRDAVYEKVNTALASDSRFARSREQWVLAPPKEVVNTLTSDQIQEGSIKITSGLRAIIRFYNLDNEITLIAYGGYHIKGFIEETSRKIHGEDIRVWFEENHLGEGDKIYIVAPDQKGKLLTIYTSFEKLALDDVAVKSENHREHIQLRHEVFKMLKKFNKFLHVKEIVSELKVSLEREISSGTLSGTLSSNSHLFKKIERTNFWGLRVWENFEYISRFDIKSLGLAIEEDDLVYQVLNDKMIFCGAKEIAEAIANYFHINKKEVIESTFINFNDKRLIRDKEGKFGLKTWVEEWNKSLKQVEEKINRLNELGQEKSEAEKTIKQNEELSFEYENEGFQIKKDLSLKEEETEKLTKKIEALNVDLKELTLSHPHQEYRRLIKKQFRKMLVMLSLAIISLFALFWFYVGIKFSISILIFIFSLSCMFPFFLIWKIMKSISTIKLNFKEHLRSERTLREKLGKDNKTLSNTKDNTQELSNRQNKLFKDNERLKKTIDETQSRKNEIEKEISLISVNELLTEREKYKNLLQKVDVV